MTNTLPEQQKYDPWEVQQEVTDIKIALHCARYWMLSEWECSNMSFPFWRLYHSRTGGSYVNYEGMEVELTNVKLIVIPPHTSFSTRIKSTTGQVQSESIKGVKILKEEEIERYHQAGLSDQFFVHFNIGFPYDNIQPGIYEVMLDEYWKNELLKIENDRLKRPNIINFSSNISITGLILFALKNLQIEWHGFPQMDRRILKVIKYIDKNLAEKLTNEDLSREANLAINSFTRLFTANLKCSVQQYVRQKRIEKAVMMLHHTDEPIEEIALKCGFYDRHHFSKVFRKQTGSSPGEYKNKIR